MKRLVPLALAVHLAAACADRPSSGDPLDPVSAPSAVSVEDAARIRAAALSAGMLPVPPAPSVRPELAELGQVLLFDPVLSGNHDISCMTCHHPSLATADGRSLAVGQGATGLGPARVHPEGAFIPRNAPPMFNLHVSDTMFWDGRLHDGGPKGVITPAGNQLPAAFTRVFEFGPISALGLFPVTSREEMRAFSGNELADVRDETPKIIWRELMDRLGAIPEYVEMFEDAYPGTAFTSMNFGHASNAMAAFMVSAMVFDDAPWDRFLRGDDNALSAEQLAGAEVFTGLGCAVCHTGPTLSDAMFHNVALAQIGPGQGDGPLGDDDFGRGKITGLAADRYTFRTAPLRGVELTAPYGHAGQFASLVDFIDHYSDSEAKLRSFAATHGPFMEPLLQGQILDHNLEAILETRSPLIENLSFDRETAGSLAEFMTALTDERSRNVMHMLPTRVPSGLPID
jgi:cytochrome c peroxidase